MTIPQWIGIILFILVILGIAYDKVEESGDFFVVFVPFLICLAVAGLIVFAGYLVFGKIPV